MPQSTSSCPLRCRFHPSCLRHTFPAVLFSLILGLDQLTKHLILRTFLPRPNHLIEILPFLNLRLVWNPGVSFGLMRTIPRPDLLLSGIALTITIILLLWLRKATDRTTQAALAMIIAGAIGNVIDRFRFGAVVDFIDVHAYSYHYPAFNVADSSIFMGVVMLIFLSYFSNRSSQNHGGAS